MPDGWVELTKSRDGHPVRVNPKKVIYLEPREPRAGMDDVEDEPLTGVMFDGHAEVRVVGPMYEVARTLSKGREDDG